MTKNPTSIVILTAVLAIGVLGSLGLGFPSMAYAEKPVTQIIPITVDPDYGATSTFVVDNVECKIATKGEETMVNWCNASATMDKVQFEDLIANFETYFANWSVLLSAIGENPLDFDQILVNFETGLLIEQIEDSLSISHPEITLPEDYRNKSVAMEWSIQNNDGEETSQTKIFMEIEY